MMRQAVREQEEALEDPDKAFKEEIDAFHKEEAKRKGLGRGRRGRGRGGRGRQPRVPAKCEAADREQRKAQHEATADMEAEAATPAASIACPGKAESPRPKLRRTASRKLGLLKSAKKARNADEPKPNDNEACEGLPEQEEIQPPKSAAAKAKPSSPKKRKSAAKNPKETSINVAENKQQARDDAKAGPSVL